jgi:hypothetical protein
MENKNKLAENDLTVTEVDKGKAIVIFAREKYSQK